MLFFNFGVSIGFGGMTRELRHLTNLLRPLKESLESRDREQAIMAEWEYIAQVMDRIFLFLFMMSIFALIVVFFSYGFAVKS